MRIKPGKRGDLWWGLACIIFTAVLAYEFPFRYGSYVEATQPPPRYTFEELEALDPTLIRLVVTASAAVGALVVLVAVQLVGLATDCLEIKGAGEITQPLLCDYPPGLTRRETAGTDQK